MRGVRVEQPPANLSATVTPPAAFAFPVTFHATRAIGLFDDNHNGGLDPVAGSSIRTFPVGDAAPWLRRSRQSYRLAHPDATTRQRRSDSRRHPCPGRILW